MSVAREPWDEDRLHDLLGAALSVGGADGIEARLSHSWGGLARFAHSSIHQHVATENAVIAVRAAIGDQVSSVTTNDSTPEGIARATESAITAAKATPPNPHFSGLAGPASLPQVGFRYDEATAAASPADRAAVVTSLLGSLSPGQDAAGAVQTGATEEAFATTMGARHYGSYTHASAVTVVTGDGATGHAEDASVGLSALESEAMGERAARTCRQAVAPGEIEPGSYEVVLLPSAVIILLDYLNFCAFSGKAFNEGRSAFSGRMGATVASSQVSIVDDPLSDGAIGTPFDGEGTPRTRVALIESGVAKGVVHDRSTAATAGVASTGHALPAPNPWGPFALHMVFAPGDSTVDQLVSGIDSGLLVTRFWYTRTVNAKQSLITGMTRDGTFRIEGGKVGLPVRNMRFNQSILEALASCDGVGDRLAAGSDELAVSRAPALRLRQFNFTSSSDH